ncbi:MAG: HXXEE domain-containing protein [Ignavibacteriales bacterium]|nr:HXXEE domain-containing protein [Ignavibacteriales bacterium]
MKLIDTRTKFAFLALILVQAMHSFEEYVFRLYDVFIPAQVVSRLISNDLSTGFLIFNIGLILFGIWCYLARVRPSHTSASGWVWLWIFVEGGNGIGHPLLALLRGGYFPGVITAPVLLVISIYLALRIVKPKLASINRE